MLTSPTYLAIFSEINRPESTELRIIRDNGKDAEGFRATILIVRMQFREDLPGGRGRSSVLMKSPTHYRRPLFLANGKSLSPGPTLFQS